jgi:hypothetical protein
MFRSTLLFFLFSISATSLVNYQIPLQPFTMDMVVIFFLIFNTMVWLHFAFCVTGELCEYLDLYRFSVKKGNRVAQIK